MSKLSIKISVWPVKRGSSWVLRCLICILALFCVFFFKRRIRALWERTREDWVPPRWLFCRSASFCFVKVKLQRLGRVPRRAEHLLSSLLFPVWRKRGEAAPRSAWLVDPRRAKRPEAAGPNRAPLLQGVHAKPLPQGKWKILGRLSWTRKTQEDRWSIRVCSAVQELEIFYRSLWERTQVYTGFEPKCCGQLSGQESSGTHSGTQDHPDSENTGRSQNLFALTPAPFLER